jgi:hypothetical protein
MASPTAGGAFLDGGKVPSGIALTRPAARGTLSRNAGEGGPSAERWVGEGGAAGPRTAGLTPNTFSAPR